MKASSESGEWATLMVRTPVSAAGCFFTAISDRGEVDFRVVQNLYSTVSLVFGKKREQSILHRRKTRIILGRHIRRRGQPTEQPFKIELLHVVERRGGRVGAEKLLDLFVADVVVPDDLVIG